MENTQQNTANHLENEGLFRRIVTFRELFIKVLKYWYWFIISVVAFLCLGVLHILSTSPVYHQKTNHFSL